MGRKREKEYSFEEAMHIARQETLPYWYRTDPLFYSGSEESGERYPQPLDEKLTQGVWTIFFGATTSWTFDQVIEAYFEWNRRYAVLGVRTLLVLKDRFSLFKGRTSTDDWLNLKHINGMVAFDPDSALNLAFGELKLPKLVLLSDGNISAIGSGPTWLDSVEIELGKILRVHSSGLPLLRPWKSDSIYPNDLEFKKLVVDGAPMEIEGMVTTGRWHIDQQTIWTQDHEATLRLPVLSSELAIAAESMTETRSSTLISITGATGNLPEHCVSTQSYLDSDGTIAVSVQAPGSYPALHRLPPRTRELILKFPDAREFPVALHGFEFGNLEVVED